MKGVEKHLIVKFQNGDKPEPGGLVMALSEDVIILWRIGYVLSANHFRWNINWRLRAHLDFLHDYDKSQICSYYNGGFFQTHLLFWCLQKYESWYKFDKSIRTGRSK